MNKRVAILLFVVLVSGVAFLGYFLNQNRKNLFTDPYKVIAPDACIVIETIDIRSFINSLTTGKGIFSELEKIKEFNNFSVKLKYIADQINKPGFKKFLQEGKALIAFHPSTGGKLVPLLSLSIPAEVSSRQIREALVSTGAKNITEEKAGNKKLIVLPGMLNGRADTVFMSISSGLMVCTTSRQLINRTLLQQTPGTDIRNAPGFSKVLLSSGKNEDKVFVIFSNLQNTISSLLNPASMLLAGKIVKLGECTGGDIYINDGGVSVSGYIESNDPSDFLYNYGKIEPVEFQTYKVLPAATALFESRVFTGESDTKKQAGNLPAEAGALATVLMPYLGDEVTRAFIDIRNNPVSENTLVIYKLKNRVQCEKAFTDRLGKQASINYFQPDDQTRIPVYLANSAGLASVLIPGFAPGFNDSSFAFYDNFMITGNSYITISRFLYDNLLNKTLSNDLEYRDFERTLPSRAGYLFYCVPSHIIDYLSTFLTGEIAGGLRSNKSSLDKIRSIGFQLSAINGMIYNSLSVSYKDVVREESTTEWETLLDTAACIKPFFFTNHITGAKEIFVQDAKNNVYLINAAGRVLWKVPLSERIAGTVYMIDYYKNGKYQLLFSGKKNLHILDRNGNYVERYPVKLRSPAANSLALFDFDNNRTYRLIIAGEDKMIYTYDKSGSVVKGWKPFRTAGFVSEEAGYYKVSGKDYLVIADEFSVYFLDRNGNERLNLNDAVTKAKGSSLRLNPGSDSYLVCTSPDGTVQNIYFDGKVKKFSLKTFSFDHTFDFFDVDGDGFGEYVFIDKGILYLYDHDRKERFTRDFNSEKVGGPINFIFSATDRKIGVFDKNKNLIYLINSKGEVMNGFPLRGASMFSIGKLSPGNEWHLIVGGTDRFLYNYKLETSVNK